jgi:hypothetical protein
MNAADHVAASTLILAQWCSVDADHGAALILSLVQD